MIENTIKSFVHTVLQDFLNTHGEAIIRKQLSQTLGFELIDPRKVPRMWLHTKDIATMFGLSKSTVYSDVEAMEKSPHYCEYVRQSSKFKEISTYGYNKYRQELSDNYMK